MGHAPAKAAEDGSQAQDGSEPSRQQAAEERLLDDAAQCPENADASTAAGVVTAVSCSDTHQVSKPNVEAIRLVAGLGVLGDAHMGTTVQHLSRVKMDPTQPNLRQVHLIHSELHDELRASDFDVAAGAMGENITTRGIDLLSLPTGTQLRLGADAVVRVTGLRTPCPQLNGVQAGLMAACLPRDGSGKLIRKAGVMGVVLAGGQVRAGDAIHLRLPPEPHAALVAV